MKSILVTGCAGFIGSNFTKAFLKCFPKIRVVGIDNLVSGRRSALADGIIFYKGSICDSALLTRIFKKHRPEYIFHFAALPRVSYSVEHPTKTTDTNVTGTVALLEQAVHHRIKRFIFSSSSSVYGGAKKLPTKESENSPRPVSPYSLQKYEGELYCNLFHKLYGIDTVSLRYFNVFGPGQHGDSAYAMVIGGWLEALYSPKGKKPYLEGDGLQSRDFCYVDNVVEANILAMRAKRPLRGGTFNIGGGKHTTLREVRRLIEKHTGRKLSLERRGPRAGDVRHTLADTSKAKAVLGYRPLVQFEEGLVRTIRWFEQR